MSDLISRQAAIDALGEKPLAWTEGEYELGLQNQWQSDVDALNDLPSVQPQRMRGKWIPQGWNDTYCKCSCCDAVYVTAKIPYSFCPNCVAWMGEQDVSG